MYGYSRPPWWTIENDDLQKESISSGAHIFIFRSPKAALLPCQDLFGNSSKPTLPHQQQMIRLACTPGCLLCLVTSEIALLWPYHYTNVRSCHLISSTLPHHFRSLASSKPFQTLLFNIAPSVYVFRRPPLPLLAVLICLSVFILGVSSLKIVKVLISSDVVFIRCFLCQSLPSSTPLDFPWFWNYHPLNYFSHLVLILFRSSIIYSLIFLY